MNSTQWSRKDNSTQLYYLAAVLLGTLLGLLIAALIFLLVK